MGTREAPDLVAWRPCSSVQTQEKWRDTSTQVSTAALCTATRVWKQPRCPATEGQMRWDTRAPDSFRDSWDQRWTVGT